MKLVVVVADALDATRREHKRASLIGRVVSRSTTRLDAGLTCFQRMFTLRCKIPWNHQCGSNSDDIDGSLDYSYIVLKLVRCTDGLHVSNFK